MRVEEITDINVKLANFRLPRYAEIPNIELYMEQLIELLDKYLSEFKMPDDEKFITSTMVNNYVKHKVIQPPVNKRYNKNHVMYLICIGILKQVFSIQEISQMFSLQIEQYSLDIAYDYFCEELESALKGTFTTRDISIGNSARNVTPLSELIGSALSSFANKIYVRKNLYHWK